MVYKTTDIGQIPKEWEMTTLLNITIKITKGTTPTSIGGSFVSKGIKFVKVESIDDRSCNIIVDKLSFIDEASNELLSRSKLHNNDLLYTIAGTIGRVAIVSKENLPANTNQAVAIIRPNLEKVDLKYLLYSLINPATKTYLLTKVVHAVQANLSLSVLGNCPIPLPNMNEQRAIAKILSDLDDKIELNRRMNKTLESIAQALFKRWFVDFEFPGYEKVKFVNGLPEGWEEKSLDTIADFLNGLALQKYPPNKESFFLPVIKIRELNQGITEASDKASDAINTEYIIEDGDILFSWSGSLKVVIWGFGRGALNQHLFKVSSSKYNKWLYYFWLKEHLPTFIKIAEGKATTMGHIQRHHLTQAKVIIPNKNEMDKLDLCMNPILDKIIVNLKEIRHLIKTRDSLLPMLISGKVRVNS